MRTSSHPQVEIHFFGRCATPLAAWLSALFAVAAGCGHSCTLADAQSGIAFVIEPIITSIPPGSTVTGCVQHVCKSTALGRLDGATLFVEDRALHDDTPVSATLTIVDPTGAEIFDAARTVTPAELKPNGAECAPTVWTAHLTAKPGNTLQTSR